MDTNKGRTLLVLIVVVVGFAGGVESPEPAFKQKPPDHFTKTPPFGDAMLAIPRLIAVSLAAALTSCATADFTPYVGAQLPSAFE
jgi:hypothetical protein